MQKNKRGALYQHNRRRQSIGLKLRYGLFCFVCAYSTFSAASVLAPETRDAVVHQVLIRFWGLATLPNGQVIQPSNVRERNQPPISPAMVNQIVDVGELSGLAEWCHLDWQMNYLGITEAAQRRHLSSEQQAFIDMLHRSTKDTVVFGLKAQKCNQVERARTVEKLRLSPNNHL